MYTQTHTRTCARAYTHTHLHVHGAGGAPASPGVWCLKVHDIISGPDRWQGSGVSPAAGGKKIWAFFSPSKHTICVYIYIYTQTRAHAHIHTPSRTHTHTLFSLSLSRSRSLALSGDGRWDGRRWEMGRMGAEMGRIGCA